MYIMKERETLGRYEKSANGVENERRIRNFYGFKKLGKNLLLNYVNDHSKIFNIQTLSSYATLKFS